MQNPPYFRTSANSATPDTQISTFEEEALQGLRTHPKTLPSKYFYDHTGDRLFQQITRLPEYYLTRAELQIFEDNAAQLLTLFSSGGRPFNLIELGTGDGHKTKVLLRHFLREKATFTYLPVDISENAVQHLAAHLEQEFPDLNTRPLCLDYFQGLDEVTSGSGVRNVVLFLGSSIGNLPDEQATAFLRSLSHNLQPGDLLLTGFDLVKSPDRILAAYNDSAGVTAAFNLNLLGRMNTSLGTDFDLSGFRHFALYDPIQAEARSYLISTREQKVYFPASDAFVSFAAWEAIHTEISRKYTPARTDALALASGFRAIAKFTDPNVMFLDSVWEKE